MPPISFLDNFFQHFWHHLKLMSRVSHTTEKFAFTQVLFHNISLRFLLFFRFNFKCCKCLLIVKTCRTFHSVPISFGKKIRVMLPHDWKFLFLSTSLYILCIVPISNKRDFWCGLKYSTKVKPKEKLFIHKQFRWWWGIVYSLQIHFHSCSSW